MAGEVLPEVAGVHWRARMDASRLRMLGRLWTATTVAHVVPFLAAAAGLMVLQPLTAPVALACLAHAWIIPELYANRGANVARPRKRAGDGRRRCAGHWPRRVLHHPIAHPSPAAELRPRLSVPVTPSTVRPTVHCSRRTRE